jgi:hypothetical protein
LFGGVGVVVALGLGAAALYSFRGPIGVRLAVNYLAARGVPAAIQIERLDLGGFTGKVRLGPQNDPDLTIDRIELEFAPIPILKQGLAAPRIRAMRLVHPRLKGRWDGRRLSFGTLQPLIDEATKKPGAGPGPDIRVEDGELRLATPYGGMQLRGEAAMAEGRLSRAAVRLLPASLKFQGQTLAFKGADLTLAGAGQRLNARLAAELERAGGDLVLGPSRVEIAAGLPYGPSGLARLDGPVSADMAAVVSDLETPQAQARSVKLDAKLQGRLSGTADRLTANLGGPLAMEAIDVEGPAFGKAGKVASRSQAAGVTLARAGTGWRLSLKTLATRTAADRLAIAGAAVAGPRLDLNLSGFDGSFDKGRWRVAADLDGAGTAVRVSQPSAVGLLALPSPAVRGSGRMELASGKAPVVRLSGRADSGPGGLGQKDAAALAASMASLGNEAKIAAALRSLRLSAPVWRLEAGGGTTALYLDRPLQFGAATLAARSGAPLFKLAGGGGSGAGTLKIAGEGLPSFTAEAPAFSLSNGAVAAPLGLALTFSGPLLHEVSAGGGARLSGRPGALALAAADCFAFAVGSVGEEAPPLASELSAKLCPDGAAPVLTLANGWSARVRIRDGQAKLPVSEATATDGQGLLTLRGQGAPETGRLTLDMIRVTDAAAQRRFNPVEALGALDLKSMIWAGDVRVRDAAKDRPLALVHVSQSMGSADGSAVIDATHLDFQPGVLQPDELSPTAGLIGEVKAATRFTGRIDWKEGKVTSSGRFDTEGAAFKSQFGQVRGAAAHIAFDSLIPVTAPSGQVFTADAVDWIAPLTQVQARFGLTETATVINHANATLAGGMATMGEMELPFDGGRIAGRAELTGIDLGALVAGSSLADSVTVQAKINGVLPFSMGEAGFRIEDGFAVATGPGRLSIKRSALTGVAVGGATAEAARPNAVQDFAYQALENLAFDTMEAKIASRPEGRLGVVFHIKGRNDPPTGKSYTEVGALDLLTGKAFQKPLALPKGTPIDLTLDTSLNFDDLLKAYQEFGISGSASVQP